MRPLRGVVIGASASTLAIKLESGRVIEMPHRTNVGKWDSVLVDWDHTKNRPVRVYRKIEALEPDPPMEEPPAEEEILRPEPEEYVVFSSNMTPPD